MRSLLFAAFSLLVAFAVSAAEQTGGNPDQYGPDETNYYLLEPRPHAQMAEEALPRMPEHQRKFVESYVRVKHYKDDLLLKTLIHPASRRCENDSNTDYYDYLRMFYLSEELPLEYRAQIMKVDPKKQDALRERTGMPLAPTDILFIEYGEGSMVEGLQRFLREEKEEDGLHLYELVKCPDEATLREFRQQMKGSQ